MSMRKCKECKNQISSKAKTCPHCGAPKEYGLGSLLILCLLGWFIYSLMTPDVPTTAKPSHDWRTQNNSMFAYSIMEDFVKKELKSPNTAKFPDDFEKRGHIRYIGNQTYEIASWVDAQNSFGATIRNSFKGSVQQNREYEWVLISLQISN